jgi:hypothetical protein
MERATLRAGGAGGGGCDVEEAFGAGVLADQHGLVAVGGGETQRAFE